MNMPQGLGRYQPEDTANAYASTELDENGKLKDAASALSTAILDQKGTLEDAAKVSASAELDENGCSSGECHPGLRAGIRSGLVYEFYLKNHLGSTMMVAQVNSSNANEPAKIAAAYDYRAFGEQIDLTNAVDKVTENFTGKEKDDETDLNYFGARYLDPMLGLWISVDAKRQFSSPYLYMGNGFNPITGFDPDGNRAYVEIDGTTVNITIPVIFTYENKPCPLNIQKDVMAAMEKGLSGKFGEYDVKTTVVRGAYKGMMANEITIQSGNGRAFANRINGTATLFEGVGKESFKYTSAHEGGHLVGLDDKYVGKNIPFKGYEDNLMGKHGEWDLKPSQVEEIFNHPENEIHEAE